MRGRLDERGALGTVNRRRADVGAVGTGKGKRRITRVLIARVNGAEGERAARFSVQIPYSAYRLYVTC
jgi:hypothetical protein